MLEKRCLYTAIQLAVIIIQRAFSRAVVNLRYFFHSKNVSTSFTYHLAASGVNFKIAQGDQNLVSFYMIKHCQANR